MSINKENYEMYFFDLMEGNLSADEEQMVRAFAAQHPELAAELAAYSKSVLVADETVVFENKESLKRKKVGLIYLFHPYLTVAAIGILLMQVEKRVASVLPDINADSAQVAVAQNNQLEPAERMGVKETIVNKVGNWLSYLSKPTLKIERVKEDDKTRLKIQLENERLKMMSTMKAGL
jgi:hypothetical protein